MRCSNVSISYQIYTLGRYHGGSSRRSSRPSLAGTHDLLSPICSHNVVSVSQKHDTLFLPITSVTSVSFRHIAGGGEIPPGNSKSPHGNFCWCKFLNVVPALLAYAAVFKAFVKKLPPGAIFELKIHKMRTRPGLRPELHWGSLQSSQTRVFMELLRRREGRKDGEVREGEKGKGRGSVPHFFFFFTKKIDIE